MSECGPKLEPCVCILVRKFDLFGVVFTETDRDNPLEWKRTTRWRDVWLRVVTLGPIGENRLPSPPLLPLLLLSGMASGEVFCCADLR